MVHICYDLNNGWVTTEDGHVRQLERKEDVIGQILIQELMILTNAELATLAVVEEIPVLYRNHEARMAAPDREVLQQQIEDAVHGQAVAHLAQLRQQTHMLLDKATYAADVRGHYGLNLPAYLHFTSPIRRYVDLVNHRQFSAFLTGEPYPYTQDELVTLAQHINETEFAYQADRAEHAKAKAEGRARHSVTDEEKLRGMGPKDLERVIKTLMRADEPPPEMLVKVWKARLKDRTVPLICKTLVLCWGFNVEGWEELAQATALSLSPPEAVSLLAQAVQVVEWAEPRYTELTGRDGEFACSANVSKPNLTFTARYRTKKGAQQRAALGLLRRWAGLEGPAEETPSAPVPEVTKEVPKPLVQYPNPISTFQEYCVAAGLPLPTYAYESSGPDHSPTVVCTCTWQGRSVQGGATSKKKAKRQAAANAIGEFLAAAPAPRGGPSRKGARS